MNDNKLSAAMRIRPASGFGRILAKASAPKSKSSRAASCNSAMQAPRREEPGRAGFAYKLSTYATRCFSSAVFKLKCGGMPLALIAGVGWLIRALSWAGESLA